MLHSSIVLSYCDAKHCMTVQIVALVLSPANLRYVVKLSLHALKVDRDVVLVSAFSSDCAEVKESVNSKITRK